MYNSYISHFLCSISEDTHMGNIVKDITDKITEGADENLKEGNKVVQAFVNESINENLNEDLMEGSHAIQDFVKEAAEEIHKHRKQTTAAVAIAATLAAGGAATDFDADTITSYTTMHAPHQVVLDISEPPTVDLDDEDEDKKAASEITAEGETSIGQTMAKVILAPVYFVGSSILYFAKGLLGLVAAPVLTVVLKWAIMTAVILGALAIAFKTAFPDIPLGKLLNKKCVSFVLVAVAVISAVCEILTLVAPQIGVWIEVIRITFGLVIMLLIFITVMRVFCKKKTVQAEA